MTDKRQLTVELISEDGFALPAYVALPAGRARGAIVVLQEVFGVNSHIRNVADGYAAAGYLAVAPAMFHRVKAGVELGYTAEDVGAGVALKAAVPSIAACATPSSSASTTPPWPPGWVRSTASRPTRRPSDSNTSVPR